MLDQRRSQVMQRLHQRENREPVTEVVGLTDPSPSAARTVRAGDDDRQRVMDLLQAHYVAGRLTAPELEERIERALAARTLADLDVLLADLPHAEPASAQRTSRDRRAERWGRRGHREKSIRAHATSYLMVMALLVTIWLLTTPGGYFWPVWPMLGWGFGLASHGLANRGLGHHRAALSHQHR
jgi:hypothetical protein